MQILQYNDSVDIFILVCTCNEKMNSTENEYTTECYPYDHVKHRSQKVSEKNKQITGRFFTDNQRLITAECNRFLKNLTTSITNIINQKTTAIVTKLTKFMSWTMSHPLRSFGIKRKKHSNKEEQVIAMNTQCLCTQKHGHTHPYTHSNVMVTDSLISFTTTIVNDMVEVASDSHQMALHVGHTSIEYRKHFGTAILSRFEFSSSFCQELLVQIFILEILEVSKDIMVGSPDTRLDALNSNL